MVRNHRFTLPNCALKLGSITCKANHIYHFNVLFAEKMSTPHPLKCSFLNTYPSENHIFCSSYFISFHLPCQSFQGYSQQFMRFPPDSCYSFRLLRRERNYAKYILIVKYFAHEQSKMTHYWLRS